MSGEMPCATPDTQSIRTTSGPLGPSEKGHALSYIDPRQPGIVLNCRCAIFYGYCIIVILQLIVTLLL